jgi:hypothetical protein
VEFRNVKERQLKNMTTRFYHRLGYGLNQNGELFQYLFFCSTLSEFENFLLCERILINVTTCQNETSS